MIKEARTRNATGATRRLVIIGVGDESEGRCEFEYEGW